MEYNFNGVIDITENKRLYNYSLTGFDILTILELAKQGKHCILVGDNKFKVVDVNDRE